MPPRKSKAKVRVPDPEPEMDFEDEEPSLQLIHPTDPEDEGITRCVCGSQDEDVGMMIQCETCRVWQHGICVGFQSEEDCPKEYYCEQCRPDLHEELLNNRSPNTKKGSNHQRNASTNVMPPSHDAPQPHTNKLTASNVLHASNNSSTAPGAAAGGASTSLSHSSSRSPSPPNKSAMSKRRNTLNSREAAYEEALERGDLEAMNKITNGEADDVALGGKRKRKRSGGPVGDDTGSVKRKRSSPTPGSVTSEKANLLDFETNGKEANDSTTNSVNGSVKAETTTARRTNKRMVKKEKEPSLDEEDGASVPPTSQPATSKKVNQAANRKSNTNTSISPVKSGNRVVGPGASDQLAVPSASASHRKGGGDKGGTGLKSGQGAAFVPVSPQPPISNSWGLPDHLSHLSDLLPTAMQGPIDVPQGHDEFVPERGAKVKWPLKRTTIGEMRRRVRAMLDYCTKAQVDVGERAKRVSALQAFMTQAEELGLEGVGTGGKGKGKSDASIDVDLVASIVAMPGVLEPEPWSSQPKPVTNSGPAMDVSSMTTAELLASLTQDLLNFQEKFGAGPGGKVYRETVPRERRPRGAAAAAMLAMERSD